MFTNFQEFTSVLAPVSMHWLLIVQDVIVTHTHPFQDSAN